VAEVMRWSSSKVKQYSALRSIVPDVWSQIKTATESCVTEEDESRVTEKVTNVTFSEGLLRPLLELTADQQRDLVQRLLNDKTFGKAHFKKLAGAYKARNEIKAWVREVLIELPDDYLARADAEIDRGSYDDDWQTSERPQVQKLVAALRDEYAQKTAVRCRQGTFPDATADLEGGSVDLILTDPPYNISGNGGVQKRGQGHATLDVDREEDWDSQERERFIREALTPWVGEWARLLRPGGSLIVFLDALLIETLWFLGEAHGLKGKRLFYWVKTNQNPAALTRRNAIPCVEQIVWLVKPGAAYTFNEVPNWNRRNYLEVPLCGGKERCVDAHGSTLHPSQKPEALIEPLLLLTSNRGDLVLDSHAGTGTTGAVAKRHGRKFIGIEQHAEYVAAMQRRLQAEP
jgi:DNA modification methylase